MFAKLEPIQKKASEHLCLPFREINPLVTCSFINIIKLYLLSSSKYFLVPTDRIQVSYLVELSNKKPLNIQKCINVRMHQHPVFQMSHYT